MFTKNNFSLLICIAHFLNEHRENVINTYQYLQKVLNNIQLNYECNFKILIHTNSQKTKEKIEKEFPFVEVNLRPVIGIDVKRDSSLNDLNSNSLPLRGSELIAFQHRKCILDNLENYDAFLYLEDDLLIQFDVLLNYLNNFNLLWPLSIPSFFLYELNSKKEKCSCNHDNFLVEEKNLILKNDKIFYPSPVRIYSACWAMPAKILKETIDDSFTDVEKLILYGENKDVLAWSASYVNWTLKHKFGIPNCLELKKENSKYLLSEDILIHHLPNRYVNKPLEEWNSKARHFSLRTLDSILISKN